MSGQKFSIIRRESLHQGFLSLTRLELKHTLFSGGWSQTVQRELLERKNAVAVIPYDPVRDEIVLIEQFRVGAIADNERAWLIEIVAGEIEKDELPEEVALRETEEEAGLRIEKLQHCFDFYLSPGGSTEKISLYCGLVDSSGAGGIHGVSTEDEDIRVCAVKFSDAIRRLETGEIRSAIPLIGLQWMAMNRERIRSVWADGK